VIFLADTVMSVGGSSSDGAQSPSTCGSSVNATRSRKRFANESPEHGREEHSRREFPGLVTRSAPECRVYLPTVEDNEDDCPRRILNDDGTIRTKITIQQECESLSENIVEAVAGVRASGEEIVALDEVSGETADPVTSSELTSAPSSFPVTSTPDPLVGQTAVSHRRMEATSTPDFTFRTDFLPDAPDRVAIVPVVASRLVLEPEPVRIIVLVDEWGRDTCVINEICELMEAMPRPWSAYRAFEAASAQFPNIDCAALRLAVMAVLMGQRRFVNRLTTAKISSACADDYRNSY